MSYTDYIVLTSKVQRNAVGQKPHSSVVISIPYSSAFVCYRVRRKRIELEELEVKRQNAENVMDIFYALARERTIIIVFCIYSAHFRLDSSILPVFTL